MYEHITLAQQLCLKHISMIQNNLLETEVNIHCFGKCNKSDVSFVIKNKQTTTTSLLKEYSTSAADRFTFCHIELKNNTLLQH